jgi:hypothetical protein
MRWRVEIADVAGDARLLEDVLERLSINMIEAEGKRFLVSEQFEGQKSAGDAASFCPAGLRC